MLVQELREAGVIRAGVFLGQGRADLRNLDLEKSVLVAEAFAAAPWYVQSHVSTSMGALSTWNEVTSVGTVPASGPRTQSWSQLSDGARSWSRRRRYPYKLTLAK